MFSFLFARLFIPVFPFLFLQFLRGGCQNILHNVLRHNRCGDSNTEWNEALQGPLRFAAVRRSCSRGMVPAFFVGNARTACSSISVVCNIYGIPASYNSPHISLQNSYLRLIPAFSISDIAFINIIYYSFPRLSIY